MNPLSKSVIAIDPGYDRVGVAIFSDEKKLVHSECFSPESKEFVERLIEIKKRIHELIHEFKPGSIALETLFFSKNTNTALKVAEARGAITLTGVELGLSFFEYSPQAIKIAVTGSGGADKKAVIAMVERLEKLEPRKRHDDEYDAIALGIAHQAIVVIKRN